MPRADVFDTLHIITHKYDFFNIFNKIPNKKRICEDDNICEKGLLKYRKYFSKKGLTKNFHCDIIIAVNGASPSGKATDSDSVIT